MHYDLDFRVVELRTADLHRERDLDRLAAATRRQATPPSRGPIVATLLRRIAAAAGA